MQKNKINKNILVVEDDPGIAEVVAIALKNGKFKVFISQYGDDLDKLIKRHKPALIFMDLWLPSLNGSELTAKLKKNARTKHIPIIIMSAQSSLSKTAIKSKADGFLAKPFEISELLAVAKRYTREEGQ